MSEDLVRQAELRHQRRPRSTMQNEEILLLDKNCIKIPQSLAPMHSETKQSLPPIRYSGNQDNSTSLGNLASQTKTEERPRTPRRRTISQNTTPDVLNSTGDHPPKVSRLPVIACKINDKDFKAHVNTGSQNSTIHRRVMDATSTSKTTTATSVTIGGLPFKVKFMLDDISVHDVVLGMDFISSNNCVLNFNTNSFCLKQDTNVPFLKDDELPLKYRTSCRTNLTASM